MRFGSLFRSCPDGHAPAAGASSRARLQTMVPPRPAFCYRTIFGAASPSATLDFQLSTLNSPVRFQRPSLQFQISDLLSPFRMNTYKKSPPNPRRMNTYKIIGLKVPLESTLTKKPGGGGGQSRITDSRRVRAVLVYPESRRAARRENMTCHSQRTAASLPCSATAVMTAPVKKSRLPANQGRRHGCGLYLFTLSREGQPGLEKSARRKLRPLSGTGHSI